MRTSLLSLLALMLLAAPARSEESSFELAFMPHTKPVTLLDEGGKYVAIDLKHIPKGGLCRMDKDAVLMRVGPSSTPEAVVVRSIMPQVSSGGCPFLTTFELSAADYSAARSAFLEKEADARKRVEDLKRQLGDKWDELMGKKPEKTDLAPPVVKYAGAATEGGPR
jgi:hypothetical protein